jgi:hypothetical protein
MFHPRIFGLRCGQVDKNDIHPGQPIVERLFNLHDRGLTTGSFRLAIRPTEYLRQPFAVGLLFNGDSVGNAGSGWDKRNVDHHRRESSEREDIL